MIKDTSSASKKAVETLFSAADLKGDYQYLVDAMRIIFSDLELLEELKPFIKSLYISADDRTEEGQFVLENINQSKRIKEWLEK